MKKVLVIVMLVAMVTMMFAGCSKKTENTTSPQEAKTETKVDNSEKKEEVKKEEKSNYPDRPINNIIPFGAGGGTDSWNRALSAAMEGTLGQKVLCNNMTGGGPGGTGTAYVWEQPHDGYTILGTSETPLTIPVMTGMEQTAKDWEYYIAGGSPGLLLVNKNSGITTFEELIEQAEAKPDEIKIASTAGGLWFILANLFQSYADIPLGNVTYDGSRPAITACVSNETAAVVASAGEVADFIKSGDLIPLTTIQLTDYDMPGYGNIEAVTKQVPELEKYLPLSQFIGFCVPVDTPDDVKAKLKEAFDAAMASDQIKQFADEQYAVIYNLTGDEAREFCKKAQSTMSWILDDMGLTEYSPADFDIPKP